MQVCELHFREEDIRRETSFFDEKTGRKLVAKLKFPRLCDGVVPSQLPNCPAYLSGPSHVREAPAAKRCRLEEAAIQVAMKKSIVDEDNYRRERNFHTLEELEEKLNVNVIDSTYWSVIKNGDVMQICHLIHSPQPKVVLSLVMSADCSVNAYVHETKVNQLGDYKIPSKVTSTNTLEDLLTNLRMCDVEQHRPTPNSCPAITLIKLVISLLSIIVKNEGFSHVCTLRVVCEQLRLMTLKKYEYSSEFLIFSSLLHNCSPQGYRLIRDRKFLILPSYTTIRRIFLSTTFSPATEQHNSNFLMYIKKRFKTLLQCDKTVSLMVDEIHLKPFLDYKGGSIVGSAYNSDAVATSAYVFMLNSIASKFKDVVHIIPTKIMKAETLHDMMKKIILGLENIGFRVISIVTDNNAINGKAVSYFADPPRLSIVYQHPAQRTRPLFFIYDAVHLLKCIRNNWLGQRDSQKTMRFPQFSQEKSYDNMKIMYAPFTTLLRLYALEKDSLLKYSYRLSLKALNPSNIEKQNVNLVLQVINEYVVQALLTLGKQHSLPFFADVAGFLEVIHKWWKVMNVKSPFKGIRLNDKFSCPLSNKPDDERYQYLDSFLTWLGRWDSLIENTGKLTKETFRALRHTTHAMLEISNYCINELKMSYILAGKFQTDNLESRFGQYRQLSGGNYNISVRQIFECEKKIRMMNVVKHGLGLPIQNQKVIFKNFQENIDEVQTDDHLDIGSYHKYVEVSQEDIDKCNDCLPVIVYLAGYCCYAVTKKMNCLSCKEMVTCQDSGEEIPESHGYIAGINRGSLLYPASITANMVMYNYIVINKLLNLPAFRHHTSQRNLATEMTIIALGDDDALFPSDFCDNGHNTGKVEKMIVYASTNAILNNYCAKENNIVACNKKNKGTKRKLQTLEK